MAKILVVDDEVGIRELLSEILTDENHIVVTAENAEAARRAVNSSSFDLIMLDIWMPDTDGVTLLKEWNVRHQLSCPVIMMSGHATIDTAVEATKYGALAFLEKPIPLKQLLTSVNHGLEVGQRIINLKKYQPPVVEAPPKPVEKKPEPKILPKVMIPEVNIELDFSLPMRDVRDTLERAYLQIIMDYENCQMTRVAKRAGLERTHLYRKLKSLGMDIPRGEKATLTDADELTPGESAQ